MRIGGFQKLTLLDYPGQVACIVFTSGCNFRCPFCHNAGLVLPGQAEEEIPAETVLTYLEKRRGLLDGVVVTGGEPLLWLDLAEFLQQVRELGYRIKLDTNGSFPERLQRLLERGLLDYIAMDVKHAPEQYALATGIQGEAVVPLIQQSLQVLRTSAIPYELRTTVVKGIHTPQTMAALAGWLSTAAPYYLQPYVDSGHILAPDGLSPFLELELEELLAAVRPYCPAAALRN